jgi:hypothetical protein
MMKNGQIASQFDDGAPAPAKAVGDPDSSAGAAQTPISQACQSESALERALSKTWTSLTAVLRSASGIPARLGELLLLGQKITPDQLEFLLAEQKRTGEKIGVLLVRHGCITHSELDAILALQQASSGSQGALRLGSILAALGMVSHAQLDEAIKLQRGSGRLLGDILQEAGYVKRADVERGLTLQRRLQRSAIAALLSFVAVSSTPLAYAGPRTDVLTVSAVVLPHVQLKVISQSSQLRVTQDDISRGYVDVPTATHIDVKSNSRDGYVLAFDNLAVQIKAVQISGLDGAVEIGSEGGTVVQRQRGQQAAPLKLGYRFIFANDMRPGDYPWPVTVSAHPL